jgi:hypothetical protein
MCLMPDSALQGKGMPGVEGGDLPVSVAFAPFDGSLCHGRIPHSYECRVVNLSFRH